MMNETEPGGGISKAKWSRTFEVFIASKHLDPIADMTIKNNEVTVGKDVTEKERYFHESRQRRIQ